MRGHIRRRGTASWEIKYDIARAEGGRTQSIAHSRAPDARRRPNSPGCWHAPPMVVTSIPASSA